MSHDAGTQEKDSKRTGGSDRKEIVKILILAIVSFLAGFAIVFALKPSAPSDAAPVETGEEPEPASSPEIRDPATASQTPGDNAEPPPTDVVAPEPNEAQPAEEGLATQEQGQEQEQEQEQPEAASQGNALPEVPPGKTPDGVAIDGDAFYHKCWDDNGVEHQGSQCDRLPVIEKRFATRLYVVDKCRIDKAGEGSHGKLSVASEVDFAKMTVSFWNGASSDIPNASQIGSCLRGALAGLPIHGVDHKFSRYRVFYTVLFGSAAEKKEKEDAQKAAKFVAGPGRMVEVVKDQVRVRKAPVDGEIIGKIGTGTQVRFIKKKEGWCNIITPNNNEGWMICDALAL